MQKLLHGYIAVNRIRQGREGIECNFLILIDRSRSLLGREPVLLVSSVWLVFILKFGIQVTFLHPSL